MVRRARPRPRIDGFAYWEKFDYWAAFWGFVVLGGSGVLLWFPGFFTVALPGWTINLAAVVHTNEALLATAFVFGIHLLHVLLGRRRHPGRETP